MQDLSHLMSLIEMWFFFKGFLRDPSTSQSFLVFSGSDRPPTPSFNCFSLQIYLSLLSQRDIQSVCAEIKYGLIRSLFIKIIVCCILESAIKEKIILQKQTGFLIRVWGERTGGRDNRDTRRKWENSTFHHNIWKHFEGINHQSICHQRIQ